MTFRVEKLAHEVHNLNPTYALAHLPEKGSYLLSYQRGTETILLVDDEESLRTVVVDLLTQLGYHMLSAANGDQALKLAGQYRGKIDLLLTDVVMDGLPGPKLAETLRQERPEMKVIFISGFADGSLGPDKLPPPNMMLVQKPFSIKLLSVKLREVLQPSDVT